MAETYGGNITVVPGAREFSFLGSGTLTEGMLVIQDSTVVPATGDYTVKAAGANATNVLGYVDTEWESGDAVVVYTGPAIARLYASETLALGDVLGCAGSGQVKKYVGGTSSASGCVVGVALEAITASTFGKVFVNITYNPAAGGTQTA